MVDEKQGHRQALIDFLAGSFGGVACVLTGQPLDTVKVKLQTHSNLYKNSFTCAVDLFKREGLFGFYAGSIPAIFANVAENSVLFLSYGQCQNIVCMFSGIGDKEQLDTLHRACAGSLASFFATFVLCPPELIKCRLQTAAESTGTKGNIFAMVKEIYRQNGFKGFYRGLVPLMMRELPANFFFFGGYEGTKKVLLKTEEERNQPAPWKLMMAGGVGGMSFWASIYPFDVIKSKVQIYKGERSLSLYGTASTMLKKEGIGSFYKGIGPTLLRAFPANAALFFAYEWSKRHMWEVTAD